MSSTGISAAVTDNGKLKAAPDVFFIRAFISNVKPEDGMSARAVVAGLATHYANFHPAPVNALFFACPYA